MKFLIWGNKLSPLRWEKDKEQKNKTAKKPLSLEQARFLSGEKRDFR